MEKQVECMAVLLLYFGAMCGNNENKLATFLKHKGEILQDYKNLVLHWRQEQKNGRKVA